MPQAGCCFSSQICLISPFVFLVLIPLRFCVPNSQLIPCKSHPVRSFFSSYLKWAFWPPLQTCNITFPSENNLNQRKSQRFCCLNLQFSTLGWPAWQCSLYFVSIRVRATEFMHCFPVLHFECLVVEGEREEGGINFCYNFIVSLTCSSCVGCSYKWLNSHALLPH